MRLRLATFNLESLDERTEHGTTLDARIAVLRPLLASLNADILCLQEVNGQSTPTGRTLAALKRLLEGTPYAAFAEAHSGDSSGKPRDVHNLVTLSRFPIRAQRQVRHEFITAPLVRICTTVPAPPNASEVTWDRPLLHVTLDVGGKAFEVINLHLRAPRSVMIPGQKENANRWTSVPGWAEGFYISSIKRNGQRRSRRGSSSMASSMPTRTRASPCAATSIQATTRFRSPRCAVMSTTPATRRSGAAR